MEMTVVDLDGCVYQAGATEALAKFSTPAAAYQAAQRLRDPTWRPTIGADCMTANDMREFVRIGGRIDWLACLTPSLCPVNESHASQGKST